MATTATGVPSSPAPRLSLPDLIQREHRRALKRRLKWLALGLGVVALAVVAGVALKPKPVPVADRFRTLEVKHGDLVREVRATGHVEAVTTVDVGAEISGRIATVDADYNDEVKQGQVLARFDRASLDAQRAQTAALVAAAHAQVAQAEADVEQAQRARQRADELFANHVISDTEHEQAVTADLIATSRLKAARAQLTAQEANAAVARTNLDHAVIRSPIDGVVITRSVDPGQTVASMLTTPTLFTVAADLTHMEVVGAVDEADIAQVQPGQQVAFSVTAWPDRVFTGVVVEVRNAPRIVQDVVTYDAVVAVDNADLALRPGMTASLRIRTAAVSDVDQVPNTALRFTPPGLARDGAKDSVWVLHQGAPVETVVHPGISDGEWTQISSQALSPGTKVLVDLTPEGKKAYGIASLTTP